MLPISRLLGLADDNAVLLPNANARQSSLMKICQRCVGEKATKKVAAKHSAVMLSVKRSLFGSPESTLVTLQSLLGEDSSAVSAGASYGTIGHGGEVDAKSSVTTPTRPPIDIW